MTNIKFRLIDGFEGELIWIQFSFFQTGCLTWAKETDQLLTDMKGGEQWIYAFLKEM